ncbi:MAG: rhamnulokinase [Clostridiales bacterium]|nr:rhamnulokinase [Clostridiales bacterium]
MEKYYLAADIGASSGLMALGRLDGHGRLALEEVHRFKNGLVQKNGHLCWDYGKLFDEITAGMGKCRAMGKTPVSIGVDTWGVDFVLLDKSGRLIGDTVAYRDGRTSGVDAKIAELVSDQELYAKCGIQKMPINTIYQLWTVRGQLEGAGRFLMAPDYFNYLLTGAAANEYTNATTTSLVNADRKQWDLELLERLGYPARIFGPLSAPGTKLGELRTQIADSVGFNCDVVLPATHDTGSAVAAAPLTEGSVYVSSGTWSLIGVESPVPLIGEDSRAHNFTNEGGVGYRFRYLKNIMGLWMIQEVQRELDGKPSFAELDAAAEAEGRFMSTVDAGSSRYLAPKSMIGEIQAECRETGQAVPKAPGELARCIYLSLAKGYASAVQELQALTGRRFKRLCIVGGGSKSKYLNRLAEEETGLAVQVGPAEATALGNIAVQMMADGTIKDIDEARKLEVLHEQI